MVVTVITFVIILGVLVFVHELGHFLVAKKIGVKVEEFGFGFPPRLFGIKRGETIYSLNWIPLGGFVKIKGEQGDERDQPDSFISKPAGKRIAVLVAGVVMNFFLAFILYTIGYSLGLPQTFDDAEAARYRIENSRVVISQVAVGSSAEKATIKIGDKIISVNGQTVASLTETQQLLRSHNKEEVTIVIDRQGQTKEFKLQAAVMEGSSDPIIGVGLIRTGIIHYNIFQAIAQGFNTTVAVMINIVVAFGVLFKNIFTTGSAGADLSGPIGVAVITSEVVRLGWIYVLNFAAILSINLGIINILPFPALDGGRVLFVLIEKIKGRPINEKVELIAHNLGFGLLILLMIFVTFHDLTRYGAKIWQHLSAFWG